MIFLVTASSTAVRSLNPSRGCLVFLCQLRAERAAYGCVAQSLYQRSSFRKCILRRKSQVWKNTGMDRLRSTRDLPSESPKKVVEYCTPLGKRNWGAKHPSPFSYLVDTTGGSSRSRRSTFYVALGNNINHHDALVSVHSGNPVIYRQEAC